MDDTPAALVAIAQELSTLPARGDSDAERLESAGRLLLYAIHLGAFRAPEWVPFCILVGQRHQQPRVNSFISAWGEATWYLNGKHRNLPPVEKRFGDDCRMVTDLLKREAAALGAEDKIVGNKVFIVHGHDEAKRRELKEILKDGFKLNPVIMMDEPGRSRTFIEKFEQEAQPCLAAVAVLTPDDVVMGNEGEHQQPRPNVLFEIGWFAGRLGRNRVLLVVKEGTQVPSDLYGIEQVRFRERVSERLAELEREINAWKKAL